MNRIVLKYKEKNGDNPSELSVQNDIKGYDFAKIGETFYGKDADIMFELLKNVDYSKIKDCMPYGCDIEGILINNE